MKSTHWLWGQFLLPALLAASEPTNTPSVVRLRPSARGYQLERNGAPFFIKGAVGTYRLDRLVEAGGNSVRTGPPGLDRAHKLGLTCLVGLPLGNPRHGFDYGDRAQVDAQFDQVRDLVRQYRDHPALLLWNLGNEPEISTTPEQRVPLWREVNRLAAMVKQEDPNHPVIAVLGDAYRRMLHELNDHCPALEAVGLNAYVDMLTLPEDIAREGWRRPYVVTEFGPRGHWQVPKTFWKMPLEDSSTAKAEFYLKAYQHAVQSRTNCLGSYAFYWAHKQEKTHTWYGMFLPDGSRTEAIDVMTFVWTGKWPANRCPQLGTERIRLAASTGQRPGATDALMAGHRYRFEINARDPEREALSVSWDLRVDVADNANVGGDPEPATEPIEGAIVGTQREGQTVTVELPRNPGPYRLFVYVHDRHGNAATANLPILAVMPQ